MNLSSDSPQTQQEKVFLILPVLQEMLLAPVVSGKNKQNWDKAKLFWSSVPVNSKTARPPDISWALFDWCLCHSEGNLTKMRPAQSCIWLLCQYAGQHPKQKDLEILSTFSMCTTGHCNFGAFESLWKSQLNVGLLEWTISFIEMNKPL